MENKSRETAEENNSDHIGTASWRAAEAKSFFCGLLTAATGLLLRIILMGVRN
jgi:hypothetical protein